MRASPPPAFSADAQIARLFQAADGGIIVVGKWSAIEGVPRAGLVKIGLNGQVDAQAYGSLSSTSVVATTYSDGRILTATRESGSTLVETRIARFLPDGSVDPGFQPPGLITGNIHSLTVDLEGRVVASSLDSLSIAGTSFRPALRFFPDGNLDPAFARASETSTTRRSGDRSMILIPDGRLAVMQSTQVVLRLSEDRSAEPPRLAAPFTSRGASLGAIALLNAPVEGDDLQYSWFFNGQRLNEGNFFYRIASVSLLNFGDYSFIASNRHGSVTSPPARLYPLKSGPIGGGTSPAGRTAFLGEDVQLPFGRPSGSAPLRVQWYRNSQPMPGESGSELWLLNVGPADSGYYQRVTSNPYGEARSPIYALSVPMESFVAEALDLVGARWATDDAGLWRSITDDTSDGVDAVRVGPVAGDISPWLQTRLVGPGTLGFRWKLGDPDSRYSLAFVLSSTPGATQRPPSRTSTSANWEMVSVELSSGVHYPTWIFKRTQVAGASISSASLDQVVFTPKTPAPPTILRHPQSMTLSPGTPLKLFVSVRSQLPVEFQWFRDGTMIPGASGSILEPPTTQAADSGAYEVRVSNSQGVETSLPAHVRVTDQASPLAVGHFIPGMGLEFTLPSEPGRAYRLQTSDDLKDWADVSDWTSPFSGTPIRVLDPRGLTGAQRFYRAIPEP
ncbi:MAG: hypothetical protein FJ405_06880 [Verrucomicrobia bacterium]|nr:hypothetical protein [Verrucomicrobiota bacterium]